jgi:hypothetical protein
MFPFKSLASVWLFRFPIFIPSFAIQLVRALGELHTRGVLGKADGHSFPAIQQANATPLINADTAPTKNPTQNES